MKAELKPIAGAPDYALSPNGYVYNVKSRRRLKRVWRNEKWQTLLRRADGRYRWLNHDSCSLNPVSRPDLSDAVPVPDYPDYVVTPYGAVWKVENLRGKHGDQPFLAAEHMRGNSSYVRLRNKFGKQHNVPVAKILKACFPFQDQ